MNTARGMLSDPRINRPAPAQMQQVGPNTYQNMATSRNFGPPMNSIPNQFRNRQMINQNMLQPNINK